MNVLPKSLGKIFCLLSYSSSSKTVNLFSIGLQLSKAMCLAIISNLNFRLDFHTIYWKFNLKIIHKFYLRLVLKASFKSCCLNDMHFIISQVPKLLLQLPNFSAELKLSGNCC